MKLPAICVFIFVKWFELMSYNVIEFKRSDISLKLRETLFWDIDISTMDMNSSAKIIVERVITRGNLDEFKQLISFYSKPVIKDMVLKTGNLDKKTLNFVSWFFDIPESEFLCCKKRQ